MIAVMRSRYVGHSSEREDYGIEWITQAKIRSWRAKVNRVGNMWIGWPYRISKMYKLTHESQLRKVLLNLFNLGKLKIHWILESPFFPQLKSDCNKG